jgi:hypothetical protein
MAAINMWRTTWSNTMILRLSVIACFVALAVFVAPMTQASTLDEIEGMVFVNRGDGYVAAVNGVQVQPGDSVVANPGGRGQVVYDDGCIDIVEEGRVVLVREVSPCDPPVDLGAYALYAAGIAGAIGLGVALLNSDTRSDDAPASP